MIRMGQSNFYSRSVLPREFTPPIAPKMYKYFNIGLYNVKSVNVNNKFLEILIFIIVVNVVLCRIVNPDLVFSFVDHVRAMWLTNWDRII